MRLTSLLLVILFITSSLHAQHEADNWIFAINCSMNFSDGKISTGSGGNTAWYTGKGKRIDVLEGTAVWSHPGTGKLMFYSNGTTVWNSVHNPMPNGTGLLGSFSTSQSALIVPYPGDDSLYYIFNPADRTSLHSDEHYTPFEGFAYSIVDMRLDSGRGDIKLKNKALLRKDISECAAVTGDCTGKGYWVLTQGGFGKSVFYAFHIDSNGIDTVPVVSEISWTGRNLIPYARTNLKFSPDGRRFALATGTLEIYDFDAVTGKVKLFLNIREPESTGISYVYGCSFSPDNSKLYTFQSGPVGELTAPVAQFDLSNPSPAAISASKFQILDPDSSLASQFIFPGGGMQLGPDGRLYMVGKKNCLSMIAKPNLRGNACEFTEHAICFPKQSIVSFNLPNFNEQLFLQGRKMLQCSAPKAAFVHQAVCEGEPVQFRDSSDNYPVYWRWSFPGGTPDSFNGPTPPPVQYGQTGNYTVTLITNNTFGTDTTYDSVHILPKPKARAGQDISVCIGGKARIGTPAEPDMSYEWTPAAGLDNPHSAQPLVSPKVPGNYYLKVNSPGGCIAYDTVRVEVGRLLIQGEHASVCKGGSVQLSVTEIEDAEYHWSPEQGLSRTDIPNPVAAPEATMEYTVVVRSGGCTDSTHLSVVVNIPPAADAGEAQMICKGESVRLGSPEDSHLTYSWSPSTGLNNAQSAQPVASPVQTTEYILSVSNGFGCISLDTVIVSVSDRIDISASGNGEYCAGETAVLIADGNADRIEWKDSTGAVISLEKELRVSPESSTRYYLYGTKGNCSGSDSVFVTIRPQPVITAHDTLVCSGESVQLHAESNSRITGWQWKPDLDLSDAHNPDPIATPNATREYTVSATDEYGCTSNKVVRIIVEPKKKLSFRLEAGAAAIPGSETFLKLYFSTGEAISSLKGRILFDGTMLSLSGKSPVKNNTGWLIDAHESAPGVLEFDAKGTGIQSGEFEFPLSVYLSDARKTGFRLELDDPRENNCSIITRESAEFTPEPVCANKFRPVRIGGSDFRLEEISPNPSAGRARLRYSIGFGCNVAISIYNQIGEEIYSSEGEQAAGEYELMLSEGFTASGIYFVRMTAADFSATKIFVVE